MERSLDERPTGGSTLPPPRTNDAGACRRDCAGPLPPANEQASIDISQPSVTSQLPSYRSAVRLDMYDGGPQEGGLTSADMPSTTATDAAVGVGGWSHGAPEAAETGRQSQELLREMRRLRLQMSELERVAGNRPGAGHRTPGHDALGVSSSSVGLDTASVVDASRRNNVSEVGQHTSVGDGLHDRHALPPSEPVATVGMSTWIWPSSATGVGQSLQDQEAPQSSAAVLGRSAPAVAVPQSGSLVGPSFAPLAAAGASAPSAAAATTDFGGWEYKPHASGDPVDTAVAMLVNQPSGRYRGWRALLCRLERGVYLCGTRRVSLRADAAAGRIEASADGGTTWADLEELMNGAEASQHALLERARGAVRGSG